MSLINDALKRARTAEKTEAAPGAPLQPVEEQPRGSSPGVVPLVLCIVGVGALFAAGGFWLKAKSTQLGPIRTEDLTETPAAQTGPLQANPANPANSAGPSTVSTAPAEGQKNPVARAASTLEKVQERGSEQPASAASSAHEISKQPDHTAQASSAPVQNKAAVPNAVPDQGHSIPTEAAQAKAETPAEIKQPEAIPSAPRQPTFKLQAIYYRLRGPTVVINGKTVKAGQIVDGAKVVSIQRTSVELEYQGKYQTITLP